MVGFLDYLYLLGVATGVGIFPVLKKESAEPWCVLVTVGNVRLTLSSNIIELLQSVVQSLRNKDN